MKYLGHTQESVTIKLESAEFYNICTAVDILRSHIIKEIKEGEEEDILYLSKYLQTIADTRQALSNVRKAANGMKI